jgi:hypothetical protein
MNHDTRQPSNSCAIHSSCVIRDKDTLLLKEKDAMSFEDDKPLAH